MAQMQFKKIGKNVTICPLAKIVCPKNISIGDETVIDGFAFIYGAGKFIVE